MLIENFLGLNFIGWHRHHDSVRYHITEIEEIFPLKLISDETWNGAFGWPTDKFVMLKIATGLIRTILKAFGIQTIQITIGRKNGKVNELIIVIVEEKRKIELFSMDCLWPCARMNGNNEPGDSLQTRRRGCLHSECNSTESSENLLTSQPSVRCVRPPCC